MAIRVAERAEEMHSKDREETRLVENKEKLPGEDELCQLLEARIRRLQEEGKELGTDLYYYYRSGQSISTWGHFFETLCSGISETDEVMLEIIDQVLEKERCGDPGRIRGGATVLLGYLGKNRSSALLRNVEKHSPALWKEMILLPQSLKNISRYGSDREVKIRFIRGWVEYREKDPESKGDVETYIRQYLVKDFLDEEGVSPKEGMKRLEFMAKYLETHRDLEAVYAGEVFRAMSGRNPLADPQEKAFLLATYRKYISHGVDMTRVALEHWRSCRQDILFYLKVFERFQQAPARITMTEINSIFRVASPSSAPLRGVTFYVTGLLYWIFTHLQIENNEPGAAGALLNFLLQRLSEEEMLVIKGRGLFKREDIEYNLRLLRERKEGKWLPLLILWLQEDWEGENSSGGK